MYADDGMVVALKHEDGFGAIHDMYIYHQGDTLFKYDVEGFGIYKVKYRKKDGKMVYKRFSNEDTALTVYHKNGTILMTIPVTHFTINGDLIINYDNGNKYLEITHKDGYYDGKYNLYFKNGKMYSES
jgi:antitoxin component YwqK of YwqJK toxin-antitoxin module